jgi:hypothetical protein
MGTPPAPDARATSTLPTTAGSETCSGVGPTVRCLRQQALRLGAVRWRGESTPTPRPPRERWPRRQLSDGRDTERRSVMFGRDAGVTGGAGHSAGALFPLLPDTPACTLFATSTRRGISLASLNRRGFGLWRACHRWRSRRSVRWTVMVSPAWRPMVRRSAALIGSLWGAVADRHEGAFELVAVDGATDLDEAAGAEQLG